MVELPGEGGSLDFFLVITEDTEREYGSARCNRNSSGNDGSKIASKVSRVLERASEYAAKVPVIVILKRFSNACWITAKLVTRVWAA
jgi:hypothetical protein